MFPCDFIGASVVFLPKVMSVEEEVLQIVATLRTQLHTLQSSLKGVEEHIRKDVPRSHLFGGPMIASLISEQDPLWFPKFLHSFEGRMTTQHLVLVTLLAHQQRFKQLILKSSELQSALMRPISNYEPDQADADSLIWYKSMIHALIKSKDDKPRIVAPQFKSAGYTFAEQTRMEESMARSPNVQAALGSGAAIEEWSTELEDANRILKWVMSDALVKRLVASKAGEALACTCRMNEFRPTVIRNGGVQPMIEAISRLPSEPERREQIEVALARLCMTTDPRIWKYPQVLSLASACYDLITSSGYELYMFEGGFGLTNLLSFSPEVLEMIGSKEESLTKVFDLVIGSNDERVQLVGTELVCNLCCSEQVVDRIAQGQYMEQLKVLPFLITNGAEKIQSAASGALAILSSTETAIGVIETLTSHGELLCMKLHSENLSSEVQLRVVSIMSNLAEFSSDDAVRDRMRTELGSLCRRTKPCPENERILSLIQSYS